MQAQSSVEDASSASSGGGKTGHGLSGCAAAEAAGSMVGASDEGDDVRVRDWRAGGCTGKAGLEGGDARDWRSRARTAFATWVGDGESVESEAA